MQMRRTQIYLPEAMHQELTLEAKKKDSTLSEVIRERISHTEKTAQSKVMSRKELFARLTASAKELDWSHAPKNLSELVDETLYGG